MDIDVPIEESLPMMMLQVVQAKLKGELVATFNKLSNWAQYAWKTWHLEVASKSADKMKGLVQMANYGCFEHFWGIHAHISEITNINSTPSKAKWQGETAQKHVNYEVSMMAEELAGVIDLDHMMEIKHPVSSKVVTYYSLRHVVLSFIKMSNGCSAIAEAHQQDISMQTHLVVPNTPEMERIIGMMNKNLPAFLTHAHQEQGLPEEFTKELLQWSCKAMMLTDMHQCKWDPATDTLTTEDNSVNTVKTKAVEGAAWFKDEFGLLGQWAHNQRQYSALEALFNLDDTGSCKTIHDCHQNSQSEGGTQKNTLPRRLAIPWSTCLWTLGTLRPIQAHPPWRGAGVIMGHTPMHPPATGRIA